LSGGRRRPGSVVSVAVFLVIGVLIGGTIAAVAGSLRPAPTPTGGSVAASLLPAETGTPGPLHGNPTGSSDLDGLASPSGAPGSTSGTAGSASAGAVAVDLSLLSVLPPSVGGTALTPDPDTAAQDAADPSNQADLSALAVAVAAAPSSGDLAVVSVVEVRPGVFSEAYYQSWRDTFDGGACSQAGGVTGNEVETTIGGHDAWVGHCAGGIVTYHVHLTDDVDRIVSISSLGPGRFGELVVDGLR
jgi:hypothetical protein